MIHGRPSPRKMFTWGKCDDPGKAQAEENVHLYSIETVASCANESTVCKVCAVVRHDERLDHGGIDVEENFLRKNAHDLRNTSVEDRKHDNIIGAGDVSDDNIPRWSR